MKVKLLLLTLLVSVFSWGQINENFDGTVTGWSFSGASATTGQICSGTKSILYTASGQFAITPSISNPNKLNCNIKRSTNTTAWSVDVQISSASPASQTSGPWTTIATIGSTVLVTCSAINEIDLSSYSGLRYVRFVDTRASGAVQRGLDDVSISIAPTGFSVTYNGNSNTSGTVPTDATSYASGATVTVKTNSGTLARTGYTFAGWNTLANGSGTDYAASGSATFSISANTTLYAKWTPNNNTITFDKNAVDATGTTATQTIATAATASLTANGFSRVGYTFAGWSTTAGGAVAYADGASYLMGTSNVTLYAVWNSTSPFITTSGTLVALSAIYGTASSTTTFNVSAGNLTNNLIITAPTGFEVSLTAGAGFATSIDLGASDRTNTTIYVRLAATTDFGTYSGDVVASSTGVTSVNVATASSNVTKKPLTITGLSGISKVYDGTTTATLSGTATLNGVVFSDDVTISGTPTSNFVDKNVGTGKSIIITGYILAGTKAANYSVTQPTGLTGNITAKALSISAPSIASKIYDGSAVSGAVTVGTLSGFISPETVATTATGTYADANAGTGKLATVTYTLVDGTNGGLATNYSLASGTGTGDITQASPVFTTSTIALNVGGTYTLPGANIISTSPGALSYSITTGGFATLTGSIINGVSVGSETLTVTQAASLNYLGGSTTAIVNVTTISYSIGDYRSATSGLWNPAVTQTALYAKWDMYNGSGWDLDVSPPATNTTSKLYIENGHIVETGTSYGNNAKIYVKSGGKFLNKHASTAHTVYIYTGGTFEFITNALRINNLFEIENGGTFIYDYSANPGSGLTLWYGNEIFHPSSNFIVKSSNSGSGNYFFPASGTTLGSSLLSSNTFDGKTAHFGNLTFDANVKDIRFTTTNLNNTLITHNNLEIRPYGIGTGSQTLLYGSVNWTIGGNFIIGQNSNDTSTTNINLTTGANTIVFNIKGDFINNSGNTLTFTSNTSANTTINLEGDMQIGSIGKLISAASTTAIFNYTGTGDGTTDALTQTIDVVNATTASNINFNINSGSYTKLINQDFALGTSTSFLVKTGGTLDFGFNGSISLNLVRVSGQIQQSFVAQTGSTLKITSPLGITSFGDYTGNVQVGATAVTNRLFDVGATYHYIGKANQVSGNALPLGITGRVIVELDTDTLVFNASGNKTIATAGTLEIRKGIVEDTSSNSFGDLALNTGNLTMSGGRYRIFKSGTQPDLSGTYNLTAGVVEFAGTLSKTIRSPKTYQNIEVTGNDVGNSSGNITLNSNGTFTVKNNGVSATPPVGIFTINANAIVGPTGTQTLTVEGGAIFKTGDAFGFSGGTNTSVKNDIETITLLDDSTVEYSKATGTGDQIITLFSPSYRNLTISGTGVKTLQNDNDTRVEEDLKVDAAKLLLNAGQILTVKQGVIIAASGAEFEVLNNAQLIQIDETDTNSGTNFKLQRLAFVNAQDYVYWSSPVENFDVGLIPTQQRYFWNPMYVNTNGTVGNWNSAVGTDATMIKGKGYIVNSGNGYPVRPIPATSLEANFVGKPNNGTFTTTIQRGTNAVSIDDNWNLIGNPYPSAIFAEEFLDANVDKINGSVWVWTHGHSPDNLTDPYYDNFGYNYYATDYLKYNKLGATDTTFNGIIASGQGFMVNMLHTTPLVSESVTFTNAMRTDATATPYNNSGFFKTANTNLTVVAPEEKHRIWLDIVNTTIGQKDAALLGYSTNATLAVDHFYDCIFVPRTEVGIYTLVNTGEYVIQGRPLPFLDSDLVPMGVKIVNAGSHKIAIKKVDGLFEGNQGIYLEDTLLGIIHDLKAAPYTFTSEVGVFNSRFIVRYTSSALANEDFDSLNNNVVVSTQNSDISIKSYTELMSSAIVYDILGRELARKNNVNANDITFVNVSAVNQALIIKIKLENGQVVTRKIIL